MHRNADGQERVLYILRGCPGSGKSTLSRELKGETGRVFSTDDFFIRSDGEYAFDPKKVAGFHKRNQERARDAISEGHSPVVIDNTNTTAWEMRPYVEMGLRHGYRVEFREPSTPWRYEAAQLSERNTHRVGIDTIRRMLKRFQKNVSVESVMGKRMGAFASKRKLAFSSEQAPIDKAPNCPNEWQLPDVKEQEPPLTECDLIGQENAFLYNPFNLLIEENLESDQVVPKNRDSVPSIFKDDLLGVDELLILDSNPFSMCQEIPDILTGQDIPFDPTGNDSNFRNSIFEDIEDFPRLNSSSQVLSPNSSGFHGDLIGECYAVQERNVTKIFPLVKETKVKNIKKKSFFLGFNSQMLFKMFSRFSVNSQHSRFEIKSQILNYLFIKSLIPFCLRKQRVKKCLSLLSLCLLNKNKHSICRKIRNIRKSKQLKN